jgi:rare lipoprotein A
VNAARRLAAALLLGAIASGCSIRGTAPAAPPASTTVTRDPAVPPPPRDLAAIPDAVPRVEPRSRYGNPPSYEVFGRRYFLLPTAVGHVERGMASWYGPGFHNERTSSGEPYDMYAMTAAHKTLPIPAYAEVTNLRNGRRVVVRINDRGPFVGDRIIDLSYTAAWKLDMLREGTAPVEVRVLTPDATASPAPAPATAQRPSPPPATPPAGVEPGAIVNQWLQVGSFAQRENAARLLARLTAQGITAARIDTRVDAGRTLHRVRVGPVSGAVELEDYIERLRLLGIPDARLAHD